MSEAEGKSIFYELHKKHGDLLWDIYIIANKNELLEKKLAIAIEQRDYWIKNNNGLQVYDEVFDKIDKANKKLEALDE